MKEIHHTDMTWIDLGLYMDRNKPGIKLAQYNGGMYYVLSNNT